MKKDSSTHCRLCGCHVTEIAERGAYLARVNPKGKGIKFVGECRPSCDRKTGDQEDAILRALGVRDE